MSATAAPTVKAAALPPRTAGAGAAVTAARVTSTASAVRLLRAAEVLVRVMDTGPVLRRQPFGSFFPAGGDDPRRERPQRSAIRVRPVDGSSGTPRYSRPNMWTEAGSEPTD